MSIRNLLQNTQGSWKSVNCDTINLKSATVNGDNILETDPEIFQSSACEYSIGLHASNQSDITIYKLGKSVCVSFGPIDFPSTVGPGTSTEMVLFSPVIPSEFYPEDGAAFPETSIFGYNAMTEDANEITIFVEWNTVANTFQFTQRDGTAFDQTKDYESDQITICYQAATE